MTPNSGGAQELTQDEQILHHYAAIVKKDLEAYHAYSRSKENWQDLFKDRLARLFLTIHFYQPFRFIQKKTMKIYLGACSSNSDATIRIHPLLLSLSETVQASEKNPDIGAISENDERALRSDLYTPPSAFPPLETHFSGRSGPPLHSN